MTVRNQTVNARAETIFENASFRVPIRQRRCLVPVSGFYGWRHEQHRKIPLYVTLKERPLFSLAGIYDRWYCRATAAWTTTFSIITTEANPLMRYVNNANGRMPVILRPDDESRWLSPALSDAQIAALLKSYPEQELHSEPVRCDFCLLYTSDAADDSLHEVAADPGILVPA